MQTAKQIFDELIIRCKQTVKDRTRRVYDPITGMQKTYIDDKLIATKQLRIIRNDNKEINK